MRIILLMLLIIPGETLTIDDMLVIAKDCKQHGLYYSYVFSLKDNRITEIKCVTGE